MLPSIFITVRYDYAVIILREKDAYKAILCLSQIHPLNTVLSNIVT
jgi:hypothetical protein